MTTEREKQECLRCAEGRGVDVKRIAELAYELGVIDGAAQEGQRLIQASGDDEVILSRSGIYWRAKYLMALRLAQNLRTVVAHEATLLLEEHTFLRSNLLDQCIAAARIVENHTLLTSLTEYRLRVAAGRLPYERGRYKRGARRKKAKGPKNAGG